MRARRSALVLTAALTAATVAFGAAPGGAIVDGQAIPAADLAPGGPWGFLTDVAAGADGECSGSLVASRWVLTAAHCVDGSMSVRVGSSSTVIAVSNAVVHPQFVLGVPSGPEFDVALLQLASPVAAPPATLPATGAGLVPVGATVEIAGFGASTAVGDTGAGVARSGTAQVVQSTTGLLLLEGAPSATAGGDSGGPAVSGGVLVGVHSFAVPGDPSSPSGEMPVAPLVPWIHSVIDAAGQPPQVTSGELQTPVDTPIEFPVQITDEQPVSIAAQVTFTAAGGTVTGCAADTPPTTCTFTPAPGFEGFGGVEISVSDGTSTGTGVWSIVVGNPPPPPNQAPVITAPRQLTTNPGQPVTFELDFRDPDGTGLTIDDVTLTVGAGGTVTCAGTTPPLDCTFVPNSGFTGSTFVRIAVTDGIDEAVRSMSVRVVAGGLAPIVEDQAIEIAAGETVTVALLAHDDLLGELGIDQLVALDEELSTSVEPVACDADAVPITCTYATQPGLAGHARLTVTFTDGFNDSTGVIDIAVLAGGAPPVIASPADGSAFATSELATLSITVDASDPEGGEVEVRYSSASIAGTCTARDEAGRAVCVLQFPLGSAGLQPVTVYAADGAGNTATVNVAVDVAPFVGNLPPRAQLAVESSGAPITGELITARVAVDDPEGAPASCRVAWGDGSVSDIAVVGTECVATHRYRTAGTMDVTATATDAGGETSEPVTQQLNVTSRRASLEGEVSWRASGGQLRLTVDASPRSGEVDVRLPGNQRLRGQVTTMQVYAGNVAEVRGTGRFGGRTVEFVLMVVDGGRGRTAVDTVSLAILDAAGTVLVAVDAPPVSGLTIRA